MGEGEAFGGCVTKERDTCLRACNARTRASCVSVRVVKTWGVLLRRGAVKTKREVVVFLVLCVSFLHLSCPFFNTYLALFFDVAHGETKALYVSKTLQTCPQGCLHLFYLVCMVQVCYFACAMCVCNSVFNPSN